MSAAEQMGLFDEAEPTDLTTIIAEALRVDADDPADDWVQGVWRHRAEVALAAIREARTVRTVEELDSLSVGTVITASGYTYELIEHTYTRDGLPTREWACAGWPGRKPDDDWDNEEPARILFLPGEDGAL